MNYILYNYIHWFSTDPNLWICNNNHYYYCYFPRLSRARRRDCIRVHHNNMDQCAARATDVLTHALGVYQTTPGKSARRFETSKSINTILIMFEKKNDFTKTSVRRTTRTHTIMLCIDNEYTIIHALYP